MLAHKSITALRGQRLDPPFRSLAAEASSGSLPSLQPLPQLPAPTPLLLPRLPSRSPSPSPPHCSLAFSPPWRLSAWVDPLVRRNATIIRPRSRRRDPRTWIVLEPPGPRPRMAARSHSRARREQVCRSERHHSLSSRVVHAGRWLAQSHRPMEGDLWHESLVGELQQTYPQGHSRTQAIGLIEPWRFSNQARLWRDTA